MPVVIPSLGKLKAYVSRNCDIKIHRMGAMVFTRNGRVLGMACNRKGNGYVSEHSYHCEEMVLDKTEAARKRERSKTYILVVRFLRSGEYGFAKPCDYGCDRLCREAGVGVFYTTLDGLARL